MTGVLIAANQNFSISQPLHAGNNKLRHIQTKQVLCRFLHLRGMRGMSDIERHQMITPDTA